VELFEEIKREHPHGTGSIREVAKKLGVHRRMVRQLPASAIPPERANWRCGTKPSLPSRTFAGTVVIRKRTANSARGEKSWKPG
jgi:hypothetical protein